MTKGRIWTRLEEYELLRLVDAHTPYTEIAQTLGRSVGAVRERCAKLGSSLTRTNMTVHRVSILMGVDSHAVAWWCREGWLKAHDCGMNMGRGRVRLIEHDDLCEFLEDEDYWDLWHPERITDLAMREWTQEMRGHVRFLTTGEVGARLYCDPIYINKLLNLGVLRGVKHGPNWAIREDWVPDALPEPRPKTPRRPFTDFDRQFVLRYWGKQPTTWIAKRLGRNDSSINGLAGRMGLLRLGRGCWKKRAAEREYGKAG